MLSFFKAGFAFFFSVSIKSLLSVILCVYLLRLKCPFRVIAAKLSDNGRFKYCFWWEYYMLQQFTPLQMYIFIKVANRNHLWRRYPSYSLLAFLQKLIICIAFQILQPVNSCTFVTFGEAHIFPASILPSLYP